ncbi:F-box/kelch-repeat protein isoform X1 [Capsicum annuum]|uniref:F-box/kelch-repeat protein At1g16250 isoform X1 n=1 Tax=Capsicum annuum TaxID=4072 RepID=UPI0007BF0A00|nr:F-box/kelch-repeat protein At1g16250 isoform X1 [Capsicum annuum]
MQHHINNPLDQLNCLSLIRGTIDQPLIPGLPDDLALRCLAKISHGYHGTLETVCRGWRKLFRSAEYSNYKAREGWSENWLFVLAGESKNQWVAYDPEADRWHPLPRIPTSHPDQEHLGFSCVCVLNKFLLIGGTYGTRDPVFPHQGAVTTNEVFQFDPFRKEWRKVASMRTPRSHFACSVVSGKVYVAGGRNTSLIEGLALAEVYNPLTDKWEDLPPLPSPQTDCVGLPYDGKFYVLTDLVGLLEQETSIVFDPSDETWLRVDDIWPFSRALHLGIQVLDGGHICTVVDWGGSSIETRDVDDREWHHRGLVPPVILPDHPRPLEVFDYGFVALRNEIYVLGGRVLRWEEAGTGMFNIVKLRTVRVCNPLSLPLQWREIRPMCEPAFGSIIGCASMETRSL